MDLLQQLGRQLRPATAARELADHVPRRVRLLSPPSSPAHGFRIIIESEGLEDCSDLPQSVIEKSPSTLREQRSPRWELGLVFIPDLSDASPGQTEERRDFRSREVARRQRRDDHKVASSPRPLAIGQVSLAFFHGS
jgi:hypothetical protein